MILQLEVIGPCLVLLAAGALVLVRPAGIAFVAAEAATLGLLTRLWQLSQIGSLVMPMYEPLPGIQLILRVDHTGIFFAVVGVGAGLLVSLPWLVRPLRRHRRHLGWVLLAQAGFINVALAGRLETLAAGWAMTIAAVTAMILVGRMNAAGRLVAGSSAMWHIAVQFTGAVLLLAGAVTVVVTAGTGNFDAVPVGAVDTRAFLLVAAAPVMALLGLGAMIRAMRDPIGSGLATSSVMVPMSCYVLVRLYDLGDGRLPDSRIGVALVLIGGVAALWFAVASLWAVDLGAAVTRLVQAAAALLLVAAGAGGGLGIAAVAIGTISVCLGASLQYALVDAGRGRLPSLPPGSAPVLATGASLVSLIALAWTAGIGGGLSSSARIATIQPALGAGGLATLAAVPAVVATLAMLYAGYGAGRFGGGAAPSLTDAVRLVLLAVALPATSLLAAGSIYPIVVSIASGALRISPVEVSNALATSPASSAAILLVFAVVFIVAVVLARPGQWLDSYHGLPRAPGFLPPPLTVAPRVWAARAAGGPLAAARDLADLFWRHRLLVSALATIGVVAAVSSSLR